MTWNLFFLILGGFLLTYLPRTLPLHLQSLKIPPLLERYLKMMPMAALGALIFPGTLDVVPLAPWIPLSAVALAGVWAFFRGGLIIPVGIALGVMIILLQIPI